MDSKVFIIHGSAIVQSGLADLLSKNFKCVVKAFYNFDSFRISERNFTSKAILFTEDEIANSEEYIQFVDESAGVKSFSIVNCNEDNIPGSSQYSIFLNNSPDEIYEQVKEVIVQKQIVSEQYEGLTNREIDVLKLVALGFSNKEIAEKLFISTHTVMSHRKNMTEKLGIKSISGLTVYAIINNYIDTTNIDVKDLI